MPIVSATPVSDKHTNLANCLYYTRCFCFTPEYNKVSLFAGFYTGLSMSNRYYSFRFAHDLLLSSLILISPLNFLSKPKSRYITVRLVQVLLLRVCSCDLQQLACMHAEMHTATGPPERLPGRNFPRAPYDIIIAADAEKRCFTVRYH